MKRRSIGFWMAVVLVAVVAAPFMLAAPTWVLALVVALWLAIDGRRVYLEGRRRRRAARNQERRQ